MKISKANWVCFAKAAVIGSLFAPFGFALAAAQLAASPGAGPGFPSMEEQLAFIRQLPATIDAWARQPTDREIYEVYPAAALEQERGGNVQVACVVTAARALSNCSVLSESPPNQGFGEAALALAPIFQAGPNATASTGAASLVTDGQRTIIGGEPLPLVGARVAVSVAFSFLTAEAIRAGNINLTNALVGGSPPNPAVVNAQLASALAEISKRGALSSDEIRAALREQMTKNPVISDRLEDFLFNQGSRTDALAIDTPAAGRIRLVRYNANGSVGGGMSLVLEPPAVTPP